MRVVHLTSVHGRSDTRIFLKECRSLAAHMASTTLVVADGKGDEFCDGVQVIDVGAPSGRVDRMLRVVQRLCRVALDQRGDIYHLHDPELLMISARLRRSGWRPMVVFDAHEDVPRQIMSKQWIPGFMRGAASTVAEFVESRVARKLAGVVAATPHIAARFRSINRNTININNYPILYELARNAGDSFVRKSQVCYIGGLTRVRGIEPLIRALPLVPNVTLVLCGSFQEDEFEKEMRALPGWAQVDYRGYVDREGVRSVLAESLAGIVTLFGTPAYINALPVKMFEYMAAELPVIASDFPLWRNIVNGAGAGLCVDPQSPKAISEAIRSFVDDPVMVDRMGKAGRSAVLQEYNWPNEAEKLFEFYKSLQ